MRWPAPEVVWNAIETYIAVAYEGPPPSAVRSRLDTLRAMDRDSFYDSSAFERLNDPQRPRLQLRLGNSQYPHMKLVIERRPDRRGCMFCADSHDAYHCPSPRSQEYREFRRLMEHNQQIVRAIDRAWQQKNLPTFKTFLREDLKRRQAKH